MHKEELPSPITAKASIHAAQLGVRLTKPVSLDALHSVLGESRWQS
jgi:hypothetical protein